jgi:amino acid transporter
MTKTPTFDRQQQDEENNNTIVTPINETNANISLLNNNEVITISSTNNTIPNNNTLQKTLTLRQGIVLVLGTIIGSGVFASPGVVFRHCKSGGMALTVWTLSGILAFAGALCYAELASSIPKAGGEVNYLERAYGSLISFLFVWTNSLITRPAAFGIISLIFGEYTCRAIYYSSSTGGNIVVNNTSTSSPCMGNTPITKSLAICCATVVALLNAYSVTLTTKMLSISTITKILALMLIGLGGIIVALGGGGSGSLNIIVHPISFSGSSSNPIDYPPAFLACLWAFDGWNNLAYAAEEMIEPSQLVLVTKWSIPIVIVLYVIVNGAYIIVLPPDIVSNSETLGVDLAVLFLGNDLGRVIMPACVAISAFGAALGSMFSGSRIVFASGRDSQSLPRCLGKTSPWFQTPLRAVLCQYLIACTFLLLVGDFERLIGLFGSSTWFFYGLTVFGMIRLRGKEPLLHRPYRAPRIAAWSFCITAITLLGIEFASSPYTSIIAFTFIVAGIPVWYWRVKKNGIFCCQCCDEHFENHHTADDPMILLQGNNNNNDDADHHQEEELFDHRNNTRSKNGFQRIVEVYEIPKMVVTNYISSTGGGSGSNSNNNNNNTTRNTLLVVQDSNDVDEQITLLNDNQQQHLPLSSSSVDNTLNDNIEIIKA